MSLARFDYINVNSRLQRPYDDRDLNGDFRPDEFIECEDPVDHVGNATASQELGYGCLKVGFCFIL